MKRWHNHWRQCFLNFTLHAVGCVSLSANFDDVTGTFYIDLLHIQHAVGRKNDICTFVFEDMFLKANLNIINILLKHWLKKKKKSSNWMLHTTYLHKSVLKCKPASSGLNLQPQWTCTAFKCSRQSFLLVGSFSKWTFDSSNTHRTGGKTHDSSFSAASPGWYLNCPKTWEPLTHPTIYITAVQKATRQKINCSAPTRRLRLPFPNHKSTTGGSACKAGIQVLVQR